MAKGRRKLRRNLIRKMRKGYLTPGERSELMDLDREVSELNRKAARNVGAGAAALALLGRTQAAQDALGNIREGAESLAENVRANREERREERKEQEEMNEMDPPVLDFEKESTEEVDLPPTSDSGEGTVFDNPPEFGKEDDAMPEDQEPEMKEPMDDAMMEMMDFTKGRLMMGGNIPFPAKLKNRMRSKYTRR